MKTIKVVLILLIFLIPLSVKASPEISTGMSWQFEMVDDPRSFSSMKDRSLAIDQNDHPQIAYGKDHLYYASYTGSAWQSVVVDPSSAVGLDASLALDSLDHAHIAYYDAANKNLKYAHWTGSGWELMVVDSVGDVGREASIALDALGKPMISYYSDTSQDLKFASWDGSQWVIQVVDSGNAGYCMSMAADPTGYPHIAYCASSGGDQVKYATWDGSDWQIEMVKDSFNGGYSISIAFDTAARIAYQCNYSLCYSEDNGTSWDTTVLYDDMDYGYDLSLALDSIGNPHISHYEDDNYTLQYAYFDGSDWNFISNDESTNYLVETTSIAIDSNDDPLIYFIGSYGSYEAIYLVRKDGTFEIVDIAREAGATSEMVLDDLGHPHISYDGGPDEDLMYATFNGVSWQFTRIDSTGDTGECSSIDLDSNGYPHIAYENDTPDDINHAWWDGSQWNVETLAGTGKYGSYISLRIGTDDSIHVAFFDEENKDLLYAKWNETTSTWDLQTVDSTETAGWDISMALDNLNQPHIAYVKQINLGYYWDEQVFYATWNGSTWQVSLVDADGDGGVAIAMNNTGIPCISYTDDRVLLACKSASNWDIQVVDAIGWLSDTSLTFDPAGNPHLSYYDNQARNLHYATWNGTSWFTVIVDNSGNTGTSNTVQVDSRGFPQIVYYDYYGEGLVYAIGAYKQYLPEIIR